MSKTDFVIILISYFHCGKIYLSNQMAQALCKKKYQNNRKSNVVGVLISELKQ